jgi:hypothetical protein
MIIDRYITYTLSNLLKYSMAELCLPLFLVVEQLREDYNNCDHEDYLEDGRDDDDENLVLLSMKKWSISTLQFRMDYMI